LAVCTSHRIHSWDFFPAVGDAAMLRHAFAVTLICAAVSTGEVDLPISDLPMDDACAAGDSECALSLRQLRARGELIARTSEAESANATATNGNSCQGASNNGWNQEFALRSYRCGLKTMGNAYWSGRCMARWQGVTSQCGTCMGQLIHCGLQCVRPCCYGKCYQGESCVSCGVAHCHQPFLACAGVLPPRS